MPQNVAGKRNVTSTATLSVMLRFHLILIQFQEALVTMSYSQNTNVLKWTVRAYTEQAEGRQDRANMIGTRGLFTSLGLLSRHDNDFIGDGARDVLGTLACKFSSLFAQ